MDFQSLSSSNDIIKLNEKASIICIYNTMTGGISSFLKLYVYIGIKRAAVVRNVFNLTAKGCSMFENSVFRGRQDLGSIIDF